MDLLAAYNDDDDDQTTHALPPPPTDLLKPSINLAPDVNSIQSSSMYLQTNAKAAQYNMPVAQMWAPEQGPSMPFGRQNTGQNCWTGYKESFSINDTVFDEQHLTYSNYGFATDPSGQFVIGDAQKALDKNGSTIYTIKKKKEKKRKEPEKPESETWMGPWKSDEKPSAPLELTPEHKEYLEQLKKAKAEEAAKEKPFNPDEEQTEDQKEKEDAYSVFHGRQEKDYQGRTYMSAPSELKTMDHECFIPKKQIHTWTGHTKGVAAIRLFPKTGHLLLSASMDATVKLWDVYNDRRCLRTFYGHHKAVRDVDFTPEGEKFLSAGWDRIMRLWDTETGQCLGTFGNGKIPYCIKFNPDKDKNHQFLVGCNDKKVYQWDTRSNQVVQEYDRHLGPVNTITFVDDNRRFVTTSDDKSVRVWDWNIPVEIKYISEPHMHSMPAVTVHPNTNWFAAQSLDNQVLVYSTKERFKLNKKKRFLGHLVAGYACQLGFSPDGRFLMSGDAEGRVFFWDWKTTRIFRTLRCHQGVCIGVQWHPIEPSRVVTCGWDGTIKYWD